MFEWTRDPNPEWEQRLEQMSPPGPKVPWLKIVWEPGDPWKPVQRWEIREMFPDLDLVPEVILDALNGPNPRDSGYFDKDANRWVSECPVSRMQWELYRKTGCHAVRFWVIQGHAGGHPFTLSQAEQRFLAMLGREQTDTPRPGALPYAEPDERTWAALGEYDKLRNWKYNMDWTNRTRRTEAGLWVQNDRLADEERWGERMLKFLDGVIEGAVDDLPRSRLPSPSDWSAGEQDTTDPDGVAQDLLTSISAPRPEPEM